jgi:hypothetical protein
VKVINLIVKDLDALIYRAGKRLDATYKEVQCALHIAERKVLHALEADMEWELLDEEYDLDDGEDEFQEGEE